MAVHRPSPRGPVTYLHRASAAELPMAPLGHHLQDSTHTSFGVVTTAFTIDRIKLEASAFSGRPFSLEVNGDKRHQWNITGRWRGNWATSVVWGRVHKLATDANLNNYLLESTLNFRSRNYVFSRWNW